jgi:hypothetical protein
MACNRCHQNHGVTVTNSIFNIYTEHSPDPVYKTLIDGRVVTEHILASVRSHTPIRANQHVGRDLRSILEVYFRLI